MIRRITAALLFLAAFALVAAGPALAESFKMKFYITNNTGHDIYVDRVAYKHHNSSWSDDTIVHFDNHDAGEVDSYIGTINNYVESCKKKRRVKIVAKCRRGNGQFEQKTFTSGWIKNAGSNMKIGFTYDECPHVKGPKVRDWS
ncbi:MAG: hypothetical protein AAF772_01565 [Acidobacteriota bacterium]